MSIEVAEISCKGGAPVTVKRQEFQRQVDRYLGQLARDRRQLVEDRELIDERLARVEWEIGRCEELWGFMEEF